MGLRGRLMRSRSNSRRRIRCLHGAWSFTDAFVLVYAVGHRGHRTMGLGKRTSEFFGTVIAAVVLASVTDLTQRPAR